MNDTDSLNHTKWECKYHCDLASICGSAFSDSTTFCIG
jgi:hypothetical protein